MISSTPLSPNQAGPSGLARMSSSTQEKPHSRAEYRVEVAMKFGVREGKSSKAMLLLLSVLLSLSYRAADAFSVSQTSSASFLRTSQSLAALAKRPGLSQHSVSVGRPRTRAGCMVLRAQGRDVKFGLGISAIPIEVLTMPGPRVASLGVHVHPSPASRPRTGFVSSPTRNTKVSVTQHSNA